MKDGARAKHKIILPVNPTSVSVEFALTLTPGSFSFSSSRICTAKPKYELEKVSQPAWSRSWNPCRVALLYLVLSNPVTREHSALFDPVSISDSINPQQPTGHYNGFSDAEPPRMAETWPADIRTDIRRNDTKSL